MGIWRSISLLIVLLVLCGYSVMATPTMETVQALADSAAVVEAEVFAPKTFQKAAKNFDDARVSKDRGKKQMTVDNYLKKAEEFYESALKAVQVARLTLADYLSPRERSRQAGAHELVVETYGKAEEQFIKATEKVESGDVKKGLEEVEKASVLFDTAELEAIRVDLLGKAGNAISQAEIDEADKYALATFDKARTSLIRADSILTYDRYNRDQAIALAHRSAYEARHASNIAQTVRSLKRNDQAWEKLMLVYEIQMNRIGKEFGYEYLPFDGGAIAAADTLVDRIRALQQEKADLEAERDQAMASLSATLQQSGATPSGNDLTALTTDVGTLAQSMLKSKSELAAQMASEQEKMSQLEQTHEQVAAELSTRQEREAKFRKAKAMINPSEGEVLFNASNDIVLRLSGLSFASNKSDIVDDHVALLTKVQEIIVMFPASKILVEGHTDSRGEDAHNRQLSEKRAHSVMQYLRQKLDMPVDRINAMGYGEERPVASDESSEGRAKNRRIDIVIMN